MEKMKKRKLLNINTIDELALQLKLPVDFLVIVSEHMNSNYYVFNKKLIKKDGSEKIRTFYKANNDLKKVHQRINKLFDCLNYPEAIQGGIVGRSLLTNSLMHSGNRYVANFDISNFFPSIDYHVVYKSFISQGCCPDVARLLTRLTTADAHLPQGFATSPKISGLVLYEINIRLTRLLTNFDLKHSFWVDDLTISGNYKIGKLEKLINRIFLQSGFKLNNKTKIRNCKQRQTCTGLIINYQPNVNRDIRDKIRKELYLCKRFGVENYLYYNNIEMTKEAYLSSLSGKISFLCSINKKHSFFLEQFESIK